MAWAMTPTAMWCWSALDSPSMIDAEAIYNGIMGVDARERPRCQFCLYACRHDHEEERVG